MPRRSSSTSALRRTVTPRVMFSTAPFLRQPLREAFRHIAAGGVGAGGGMGTRGPAPQGARPPVPPGGGLRLQRGTFLVLDTSHAAVATLDIREFYQQYAEQIQHVHLSQNAGRGWDSHMPVYQDGVLPLADFLGDLEVGGFAGNVSIELDLRPWFGDEDALH